MGEHYSDGLCEMSEFGPMTSWDVRFVTNTRNLFQDFQDFNADISSWNTSQVTDMGSMFSRATSFNQPISDWDTSKVTQMYSMFSCLLYTSDAADE